ncbi:hypothetical protein [Pleomorphomonas carboxyditropha]|uniref:Uncharacterized protein n=1 Tax=Pleomorphomonas carboxyditropha TaxID=2023338 RepID=A0A2G9WRA4_9HYPH|nr:hypothetical protein [Pleomorphomonas carboxyditropha]PIO96842.1 hypothetical protein CJ014_23615 [Pleomorphomonas carboxyditropha]
MTDDPIRAALEAMRNKLLADLAAVAVPDFERDVQKAGIVFAETMLSKVSALEIMNGLKPLRKKLRKTIAETLEQHDPAGVISREHRRVMMDAAEKLFVEEIQRAAAEATDPTGPAN